MRTCEEEAQDRDFVGDYTGGKYMQIKYLNAKIKSEVQNRPVAAILQNSRLVANNFVAFNYCGNADSRGAILRFVLYTDYLAHCANEYFRTARDFGG